MKRRLPRLVTSFKQFGFTMIELLIVMSILGILSVAVLSAINPIEQINRGKDTGSQSDAEQLLSAIDRYYAFNTTYPWQGTASGASDNKKAYPFTSIATALVYTDAAGTPGTTKILDELKSADEIKNAFVSRLEKATNKLYLYYDGTDGDNAYVCFKAQSNNFKKKAAARCVDVSGTGLPSDLKSAMSSSSSATLCGTGWTDANSPAGDLYSCLP